MRWKTRIIVPLLVATGYSIASFFTKIVPCQIYPNIPNPSPEWGMCTLNPDRFSFFGIQETYLGVTSQLSEAFIISFGIIFICCFLLLIPFTRHKQFFKSKNKRGTERGFETY